ncbi:MAG: hypothetical protein HKN27_13150 [Silicimonas sp.]|nr:hypothetical protein [Silicimonas sp.]
MRLICPNCSAQYEIDVTLIPDEGRDVQCSNCGHTWFELPPPAETAELAPAPEDAPEPEDYDDPAIEDTQDPEGTRDEDSSAQEEPSGDALAKEEEPSQAAKAIAAATEDVSDETEEARAESEPFKDVEDPFEAAESEFLSNSIGRNDFEDDNPPDVAAIAATTLKARRPSDAANVDLLREEAERELSQRRAPPSESLESQPDFGLDEIASRSTPSRALRARMARSSGDENTFEETDRGSEADYKAPQRDLLPDIDEINSSLSQNNASDDPAANRGGFRLGFGLMLVLSIAAICIYAFAPALANAIPGAESALIRFVDVANQLRDWIDGLLT